MDPLVQNVLGSFAGALGALIVFWKFMATHGFIRKSLEDLYKRLTGPVE